MKDTNLSILITNDRGSLNVDGTLELFCQLLAAIANPAQDARQGITPDGYPQAAADDRYSRIVRTFLEE